MTPKKHGVYLVLPRQTGINLAQPSQWPCLTSRRTPARAEVDEGLIWTVQRDRAGINGGLFATPHGYKDV